MSLNPERERFADTLHDAAAGFDPPETGRLYGAAVRRGRQIKRRRAGATALGCAAALGMAGALAFALPVGAGHGATAVNTAPAARSASPGYTRPSAPAVRPGGITGPQIQAALEYALPADIQLVMDDAQSDPKAYVDVVDPGTHSWYVQTDIVIKSDGPIGTSVAVSVSHTGVPGTCATLSKGGTCTRSTLDGGELIDNIVPPSVLSSNGVFEFFEWFSPAGYETDLELQDDALDDFAVTKAEAESLLTNRVFATIAHALPADACVGGTFSKPVDPPKPGQSPLQHVRCSTNGELFPSY